MIDAWTLVERCCGSAAVTLHLLGAKRALLPYQGGKWRHRRALEGVFREVAGVKGSPERVSLIDANPLWPSTLAVVLTQRARLLAELRPLVERGERDPHGTLRYLLSQRPLDYNAAAPDYETVLTAARHLWLQRMALGGFAVGLRADGGWAHPGASKTSLEGAPARDDFGEVRPQGRSLLAAVEGAPEIDRSRLGGYVGRVVYYIDPPYENTRAYPGVGMTRDEVVRLALGARARGWATFVSEASPVGELVSAGWHCRRIATSTGRVPGGRGTREEWVTYHDGGAA